MNSRIRSVIAGFLFAVAGSFFPASAQTVPVTENLWRLVPLQDTDGDKRITVHDKTSRFALHSRSNDVVRTVEGVYPLSVLLQELKRAEEAHRTDIALSELRLDESIVDRTHRLIRTVYWDALTRRIDAEHIDNVVPDSKAHSKADYIYVPQSDPAAIKYFQSVENSAAERRRSPALKVVVLPASESIDGAFVRRLDGEHGLLGLSLQFDANGKPLRGTPYVVPGGRFNELYYWDSYFTVLGLLQDGRKDLARGMAENLLYAMEHYGKVPNANRSYYLTRSQPPFLTSMIRAVFDGGGADRAWLEKAMRMAMKEYQQVWLGKDRLLKVGGHQLSRYYDEGSGPCPEVEPGHYDEKIRPWLEKARATSQPALTPLEFLNRFLYCGEFRDIKVNGLRLDAFFKHDRAVRESGHDTTHRFDDRTADFVSVDLNSLLFRYEMDFAEWLDAEHSGRLQDLGEAGTSAFWRKRAEERKAAMMELMWDETRGFFFDYDFANSNRSSYISATGLYPLWARLLDPENPTDANRARRMAAFAREKLEQLAGLSATAKESVAAARMKDARQWDYPYGWAPHQMLAWQGLKNYGLNADAERLAYRWLFTIAKNARDYNGTIPEKYNVVTGSHDVFVEYGNVGTKFAYIAPEGFGWMNASFQVGTNYLSPQKLADLRELKPPSEESP